MTVKHPTDDEIQQYALDRSGCEPMIIEHVELCEECKDKAATYQLLFTGIQQQPEPVFNFNLEEMVLAQLPQPRARSLPENFYIYLLILAGTVLTGTALYIFRSYVTSLFEGIAALSIYLIVTTVIIILTALGIDMYKSYQKKMNILDLY